MDEQSAIDLYLNEHRLRHHVASASTPDKVAALRHIRSFIARAKSARDAAVTKGEAALPDARKAIADAGQALTRARAAEQQIVAEIARAQHEFAALAGVLELRAEHHHTPHELVAAETAGDTATADA